MSKSQEVWRDIPGWEGLYQASTWGRIRRLNILKPSLTSGTGYPAVGLPAESVGKHTTSKRHHVHALVALTFIGPRPLGMHIDHKDGNRENAEPENLEYVTPKENNHRSYVTGNNRHRLSEKQMDRVADLYFEDGRSALSIAKALKVNIKAIHSIVQIWRCQAGPRKKNPYQHKLTRKKFVEMKKLYETSGLTITAVAKVYGLSPSHASRVLKRDSWGDPRRVYKTEREENKS
jgi:transposase